MSKKKKAKKKYTSVVFARISAQSKKNLIRVAAKAKVTQAVAIDRLLGAI